MGFFSSVLGGATAHDPTTEWSFTGGLPTPEVQLASRRIGPLTFGAPLAEAQCFGRPDLFRRTHHDYFELVYARAGFQLDFEAGRLVYGAFFVGPDEFAPACRSLRYSRPQAADVAGFSDQTTKENLVELFGPPISVDRDAEETIVCFARNGLTLEFELNGKGCLKRWNLYPEASGA
jgi:hypothetical protein